MSSILPSADTFSANFPVAQVVDEGLSRQFLTFMLAEEMFAMSIDDIREIIQFTPLTSVPLMPDFLRGVLNLRGAVVPVIDLSVRLGRTETSVAKRTCIVILELMQNQQRFLLGVMVDAVRAVLTVEHDKIEPPLTFGARLRTDFVEGMLNIQERFIVALNVKSVFSIEELAALIGMVSMDEPDAGLST